MTILVGLLTSKLFWSILGPLAIAALAYFKGYSHGSQSVLDDARISSDAIKERLHQAEATNQNIEKQAEKSNEIVNNASSIDELISVFNSLQSKDRSNSPDKNTK